jgi:predicted phosphodiesterase
LSAALADAQTRCVDKYIFLGDYYRDLPWPNEVVDAIRSLKNASVIKGNNEGYLVDMRGQDQSLWTDKQNQLLYWSYKAFTPENLGYLFSLPESAEIADVNGVIRFSHSLKMFYHPLHMRMFTSSGFREMMERKPISHEEFLALAREIIISNSDILDEIRAMPEGVYLFGHQHNQFHVQIEGRLFINPGSCGAMTDFNTAVPYTLLDSTVGGWNVTERRVAYDIDEVVRALYASDMAACAPVWCAVIEQQLREGKDHFGAFVRSLRKIGREHGQLTEPVTNDVFELAEKMWKKVGT